MSCRSGTPWTLSGRRFLHTYERGRQKQGVGSGDDGGGVPETMTKQVGE